MFPWMQDELNERRRSGLYRERRRLGSAQQVRVRVAGRELINFSSNDYLALAADPRLARSAARCARRYGTGAGASPLVSGCLTPLALLERDLARWQQTEAALVFTSGYIANLALLSTLAGKEDVVFSDRWNHASLIDGCRLSRARVHIYNHADANHLGELLRQAGPAARRRIIVSDGVFSMDGDLAPLAELLELAHRHDAIVLLDDAHATGVLGDQGRGALDLLPAETPGLERVIKVGTLSKALGAQGGFVCGSRLLVDWLVNHARPYIFSTALAPPMAAAARRAIAIVRREPDRRARLLDHATYLRDSLREAGYEVGGSACHIIPVLVGEPETAVAISGRLQEMGLLVPAIRPPSVPPGTARLRISLTAGHERADVDRLIEALREKGIERPLE
jgi:8-amino-7-oxononanoate synthase